MKLEATHLRDNRYAVRPAGALGTTGFIDGKAWQAVYVTAKDCNDAVRKAQRKLNRKPPMRKPGPLFSRQGFYVEGRHFENTDSGMYCASAFAASLAEEYKRQVDILTCLLPGVAMKHFAYFAADSMEAETRLARKDAFGYVLTCAGQTIIGVR